MDRSTSKRALRTFVCLVAVALAGRVFGDPGDAAARRVPRSGLLAHWTFDRPPGRTVRDASGAGRDGVVHGTIQPAAGVSGTALRFPAPDSCIAVQDSPALSFASDAFSVAVWVNAYYPDAGQQMIIGKNVYVANKREWGLMIDRDRLFRFYLRHAGAWHTVQARTPPVAGHWVHVAVTADRGQVTLYVNGRKKDTKAIGTDVDDTDAPITLGAVRNGATIFQGFTGALDEVCVFNRALSAREVAQMGFQTDAVHEVPERARPLPLWDERVPFPELESIPLPDAVTHAMVHRATMGEHQFLHGAALIHYKGTLYASWANSPVEENSAGEILRGRRSTDGGLTWGAVEVIGPGFDGPLRHSHGVFAVHGGELWAFAAKFGIGKGRTFPGLCVEAFVLHEATGQWRSRGIVMQDCWPYDQPKRMADGNYITGGQDKDQYPVVAISRGDDFTRWDSVGIPVPPEIPVSFAETTVLPDDDGSVLAIIRPAGVKTALVSSSGDNGRTWTPAAYSTFPMAGSKPYACELRNGQRCLISNWPNRDTLTIAVTRAGETLFCRVWRIRHGACPRPKGEGRCAKVQWSYPYAHEHDGKLYVIYSVGKEDCAVSIIPVSALAVR